MELDKRIKEGKHPLNCFDTEQAMQFIGKKCYFSDDATDFMNLDKADGDTLFYVAELQNIWTAEEYCFADNSNAYRFILPFEWVKPEESEEPEKTYRPYTVMEFIKEYPLGSHLHFRPKSKLMEMHRIIDGYNDCLNGAGTLFMCGAMYSMSELYDNYDIFKDGEWQPFGVLDEQGVRE